MCRILVVATVSGAGMGPYVSEIANTFSATDDVYFIFSDADLFYKKNIKEDLHKKSVFYSNKSSRIRQAVTKIFDERGGLYHAILEECKRLNIDIVHFINGCRNKYIFRKLKDNGIKILNTVHDIHPHESSSRLFKRLREKIYWYKSFKRICESRYLVTNSKMQFQEIKDKFTEKHVFFHEFPSLVTKEIQEGTEKSKELENITKPYILFFGRIQAYKGLNILCNAFVNTYELNKDYNLVIAGSGKLNYEIGANLDSIVFINRYIKDTEIAQLYKNAAAVVYPYTSATQSGVLSLAFYYQVPVLTSDIPYFKAVINHYCTGYIFKSGDSEDLASQLKLLLGNDNNTMKKNQADYYSKFYQNTAIRKQLLEIYASIYMSDNNISNG